MTAITDPQALLYEALAQAQADFPAITRDRTVRVQTKAGGSYTFAYAPLASILAVVTPVLSKHGLAVTQLLTATDDGRPAIRTMLLHQAGGSLDGCLPIKTDGLDPQALGSLVTYVRRYALVAMLGIASEEDDDANHATGNRATNGAASNVRTEDPAAPAELVAEIERLIDTLNSTGALGEVEIRDGMHASYGTSVTGQLTKSQAENLRTRLAAKAEQVPA